jgi:Domain of unknown function (DUF4388)
VRTTFAEQGDLRGTDVLAALVALWRESASGSLRFSRSGATAGFHLTAGEVTAIYSSESRFETAAILLRAGKLEPATLDRLSTPSGGDRALAALHAGILTKREWRWGEKIRAVEVLSDLLTWLEGDYIFDRGAHSDAGEFRLSVPRMILELFLRSRDRGLVLHYLGGADVPLARAPHFESEFIAFGLTADAEAVVRLIDGKATAAQIASEGPAEPFAVEKLLAALVTLGLVHPEFVAAEAAPRGVAEAAPREAEPQAEAEERDAEDWETAAEEEPADAVVPYSELDVPLETHSSESELGREVDEAGDADDEVEEPAVAESEIGTGSVAGDEPSIGASPLHPVLAKPESAVEDERLGDLGGDAGAGELVVPGPTSLEQDEKPRTLLDFATGVGSPERPKRRSSGPLLWLLVLLAAGVTAVILFRDRGGPTNVAASARTPSPVVVPTGEAAVLSAVATPAAPESPAATPTAFSANPQPTKAAAAKTLAAKAPTTAPAASPPKPPAVSVARPTPRPAATAPPSRAAAPPEATGSSRQAWLDRAARDLQKASADHKNHFTIQLELACETSTLVDASKYDRPAGTMWVLTTPFKGQTCFRVLWGRYPSKEAARRALAGVPAFFNSAPNRPVVTAIR